MARPSIVSGGNQLLDAPKLLKEHLRVVPGQVIAALGCGGAGFFSLAAARIVGDHGQVYAVDIQKTALSSVDGKAKLEGLYNIKTVWSDLEVYGATSIPEASLDHALLVNILFQSKKHEAILKETARMVKPDGKLLVIDWNDTRVPFAPRFEDRVKAEVMRSLVPQLGFREEKFFEAGPYHFGLIFTKL